MPEMDGKKRSEPTVAQASDTSLLGKILDAPEPKLTPEQQADYAARMTRLKLVMERTRKKLAQQTP